MQQVTFDLCLEMVRVDIIYLENLYLILQIQPSEDSNIYRKM